MEIAYTKKRLRELIDASGASSVGLVPTMGALHEGHISLIRRSVADNGLTVASVFVNPTQFNDKDDLARYPRTPEADAMMLEQAGCDIAFMPSVEEMYPEPDERQFDFAPLDKVMEGSFRPGHFNGVAQIVSKLFYAVEPDNAYFGEKDFQQVAIIREMTRRLGLKINIVACPIVREPSGLAKSSRNALLTPAQRDKAALISKTLFESVALAPAKTPGEVREWVASRFAGDEDFRLDYYDIVDGSTLQSISGWDDTKDAVGCIAIYLGKIRLIDNVHYQVVKQ